MGRWIFRVMTRATKRNATWTSSTPSQNRMSVTRSIIGTFIHSTGMCGEKKVDPCLGIDVEFQAISGLTGDSGNGVCRLHGPAERWPFLRIYLELF